MIVNSKIPYYDMVFLERQTRELVIRSMMTRNPKGEGHDVVLKQGKH